MRTLPLYSLRLCACDLSSSWQAPMNQHTLYPTSVRTVLMTIVLDVLRAHPPHRVLIKSHKYLDKNGAGGFYK